MNHPRTYVFIELFYYFRAWCIPLHWCHCFTSVLRTTGSGRKTWRFL